MLRREEHGYQRGIQESMADLAELRSTISANLSHEMRTPLAVLLPTLELIIRGKFTESNTELTEYVKSAISSAHRINFLVEDLEMMYNIDQGMISSLRQTIDLNLHFKTPIMQTLKAWEHKNQYVQLNINRDVVIHAPRAEFSHMISHLMDNACKFGPENGKITISLSPNGVGGCILDVVDEGESIPMELRDKVFERYFQISQGDIRKFGGLGVGLTIARAHARAWGGDIWISNHHSGCRVRMVLPPLISGCLAQMVLPPFSLD
jgi:signal transduction histidine kinase